MCCRRRCCCCCCTTNVATCVTNSYYDDMCVLVCVCVLFGLCCMCSLMGKPVSADTTYVMIMSTNLMILNTHMKCFEINQNHVLFQYITYVFHHSWHIVHSVNMFCIATTAENANHTDNTHYY